MTDREPQKGAPGALGAVTRRRLGDAVQDELKAYILRHRLRAGDPLPPEGEIAAQLGVSRNSVRESVKTLEGLGILEARAGSGVFVREFSLTPIVNSLPYGMLFNVKSLREILEIRCFLELASMEKALSNISPEQLAMLEDSVKRMRVAAERGELDHKADRDFHGVIADSIDNKLLAEILALFWTTLDQALAYSLEDDERGMLGTYKRAHASPDETYALHLGLLDAVKRRDVAAAQEGVVDHYQRLRDRLSRVDAADRPTSDEHD